MSYRLDGKGNDTDEGECGGGDGSGDSDSRGVDVVDETFPTLISEWGCRTRMTFFEDVSRRRGSTMNGRMIDSMT